MRKLLLFFGLLLTATVVKAAPQTWSDSDGNFVEYDVAGNEVRIAVSNAGALAAFFNSQDANAVFEGNQTLLKIEKKGDDGALNADDLAALNSSTHAGLAHFTKLDMDKVPLEEGASVKVIKMSGAEYMALPHGTPIADMKALGTNCTSLKAVAATDADQPTAFTGYSWAAGEIWNICQLEPKLVDGIEKGICANTMQKLTIGGNVDDRDASTLAIDGNNANKKSEFEVGASATYYRGGGQTGVACAVDYIAPSHPGNGCSPWKGGTEIEIDFTEAIFANKGDIALVSYNTKELLLPIDPTFTEIKPNMFANLPKLRHIIIPNNIVTIGDAAFYCNGGTYLTEEISIGNGIKTIGNSAFAASGETGRSLLTDIRFEPGVSDVKILACAFMGCKAIKHMMLPEGIVSLGESCFNQLLELESVHFPTTLEYIGINCFRQTGLTMLTIPASVKVIDYNAFSLCRITDIFLMAENLNQLPYIYAEKYGQLSGGDGTSSTFDSHMLFGNNTTADNSQHDAFAAKDSQGAEELFRLSVNGGNTISKLHFHENLKDFIDMNPWYFEGQTTPKPSSDALGGNGGINEEKHLSDTYYLVDKENQTYPCLNAGDLNRAAYSAYFNSENHQWGAATDYTTDAGTQVAYYNPDTGVLSDVTEDANHIYKVLRKEGWRQFTFKAGDAASDDITFHKQYDNVWYTMCFPFSLTDEQLESAFNAEYNIADFSGIEVIEENEKGNKEIVLHFNKIAKAKYYDQDHNEYQRVEGSKQTRLAPNGAKFNTYTYTRGGKNYTYTATFSNKSYKTDGDDEIYYIDGYLAQAGRPYMIHPNLGTSEGQPSTMTHMVGINYYSRDPQVIDQLCKDLARSVDLGTGKGYEGVTYAAEDASDIAIKEDEEGNKIEITENIAQAAYSKYPDQTYSFVGNCNEYSASAPPYPSVANGGLEPDPEYPVGAVVKPTETISNPNPELENPADKYSSDFLALYNASVTYYDKNDSWRIKTSTYGEIIEYKSFFVNHSDGGKNYYTRPNGNDQLDFSAMQNYFGRTDYFTDDEYNLLKNMCLDVAAWNAGSSSPEYQAYLENKAAHEVYDAALQAYLDENPGSIEEDFNSYVSGLIGQYNRELQSVQRENERRVNEWNENRDRYAVYIPENAYFLSRKSTEYYTHFFREKASLEKRKQKGTGKWSRYSAVLIPNDAALNGVETAQDPAASKAFNMAFDEAFYAAEDATAIEQVVEEAKEKGMKVEYINVVVSIDGKVVRRGDTSLEGLPSGLYIVNGKKYFVK